MLKKQLKPTFLHIWFLLNKSKSLLKKQSKTCNFYNYSISEFPCFNCKIDNVKSTKMIFLSCKNGSGKVIENVTKILQVKYSGSLPAFVGCQKDSESTVENRTHVKPVLLAVFKFAVHSFEIGIDTSLHNYFSFSHYYER